MSSLRFEERTITVEWDHRPMQVNAFLAEGTGLAYAYDAEEEVYALYHLASGKALVYGASTRAVAQRWLELVSPLTDWTQPVEVILAQGLALPRHMIALRNQAHDEVEQACCQFLSLVLSPQEVKQWVETAFMYEYTTLELVSLAVHALLHGEVSSGVWQHSRAGCYGGNDE